MQAHVQYNDFVGTAAADISDYLGSKYHSDDLDSIGKYFQIDETRFRVIGISFYSTEDFYISLLCVDRQKSTSEKEHIVDMSINNVDEKGILALLFKRLQIVLHSRFGEEYQELNSDEEVNYEDFHGNQ